MHWLYHIKHPWQSNGNPAQEIYVRAVDPETSGEEERLASKIIQIYVFALDFYFLQAKENPLDNEKGNYIYATELSKKDFYIEDMEVQEEADYLLRKAVIYLKTDRFDEEELLSWIRTYLSIEGFPFGSFEQEDFGTFSEMNPLLRIFSLENVRKFEDKLGKEWWKSKKDTNED